MLALIGAEIEDTIDDLFPGSGAVTRAIEGWRRQPVLPTLTHSPFSAINGHRRELQRDMRLNGAPRLAWPGAGQSSPSDAETAAAQPVAQGPPGAAPSVA